MDVYVLVFLQDRDKLLYMYKSNYNYASILPLKKEKFIKLCKMLEITFISSTESIATPAMPTSPVTRGLSES